MNDFIFPLDENGKVFTREIVSEMKRLFRVTETEAVGRINRRWKNVVLIGEHVLYHEDATFWAKDIYYGHDCNWWKDATDLKPQPYP